MGDWRLQLASATFSQFAWQLCGRPFSYVFRGSLRLLRITDSLQKHKVKPYGIEQTFLTPVGVQQSMYKESEATLPALHEAAQKLNTA
jgi:hypothetical protein